MRLKNKVSLITGGSGGIGGVTAIRFAQEGAKILVQYHKNIASAEKVVINIKEIGGQAISYMADVRNRDDVKKMCDAAVDRFGTIDILVNYAGVSRDALLYKMTEEQWDEVIDVNLKGSFNCAQFASIPMVKQKYGRIINIASGAIKGQPGQANYSAAKSGLMGLTRTLAFELGKFNIVVNCIALPVVETEMSKNIESEMRQEMINRTALKRIAKPIEIANIALFFASDECTFITGQTIEARGGAR
ncbi:MAG: 3-oxoacyl-ACP reductase family protein [Thermodesulfobacteriota bacterium]